MRMMTFESVDIVISPTDGYAADTGSAGSLNVPRFVAHVEQVSTVQLIPLDKTL
jgi:hypothetical protein